MTSEYKIRWTNEHDVDLGMVQAFLGVVREHCGNPYIDQDGQFRIMVHRSDRSCAMLLNGGHFKQYSAYIFLKKVGHGISNIDFQMGMNRLNEIATNNIKQ